MVKTDKRINEIKKGFAARRPRAYYHGALRPQNPKHLSRWICRVYPEYGPPYCVVATSKDGLPVAGLVAGSDVFPPH